MPLCIEQSPHSEYLGRPKQLVRIRPDAPPQVGQSMKGIVQAHPCWPAGTEVCTSPILSVQGNRAETRSSVYILC